MIKNQIQDRNLKMAWNKALHCLTVAYLWLPRSEEINQLTAISPLQETVTYGTKNSLLDGKQRSVTVKRKDISFLNDVTTLIFFA